MAINSAAALAKAEDCEGVDMICLPEVAFDIEHFIERLDVLQRAKAGVVIAVSEGVRVHDGRYVCELTEELGPVDAFGHKTLTGAARYVLHFDKGQLPPAKAFWSLSLYGADQFFVANPLNRYAIGDRDKLVFNPDGSLDIHVQHESPGKDKEANWLPAPAGKFVLMLRMYWPKDTPPSVIDGS